MKVSHRVSQLQTPTVGSTLWWLQFTKGHNYVKSVHGVTVLVLCTLSDDVLYVYQVSKNISKISQLRSEHNLHTEIYKEA